MHKALVEVPGLRTDAVLQCYHHYMGFAVEQPPGQKTFLQNMEAKMQDSEFIGDIKALIRPAEQYSHEAAFELVRTELLEKLDSSRIVNGMFL